MSPILALTWFFALVVSTEACRKEIVDKITALSAKAVGDGIESYVKDRTFIDVMYGGTYMMRTPIHCTWVVFSQDRITYRKKNKGITEVMSKSQTVTSELPVAYTVDSSTGVFSEKDYYSQRIEYLIYPMYLNKEAGVFAYHRCTEDGKTRNRWRSVIAVEQSKFTLGDTMTIDKNTEDKVNEAFQLINSIEDIVKTEKNLKIKVPKWCVHKRSELTQTLPQEGGAGNAAEATGNNQREFSEEEVGNQGGNQGGDNGEKEKGGGNEEKEKGGGNEEKEKGGGNEEDNAGGNQRVKEENKDGNEGGKERKAKKEKRVKFSS